MGRKGVHIVKIELNLSEETELELRVKAARGGLTASELLSAFVHDLVEDDRSNGSDERMYANDWYDRCYFTHGPADDFYTWLARRYELEAAMEDWSVIADARADMEYDPDDEEYVQELQEVIEERSKDIAARYRDYGGSGDWEQEMAEAAKKWEDGKS